MQWVETFVHCSTMKPGNRQFFLHNQGLSRQTFNQKTHKCPTKNASYNKKVNTKQSKYSKIDKNDPKKSQIAIKHIILPKQQKYLLVFYPSTNKFNTIVSCTVIPYPKYEHWTSTVMSITWSQFLVKKQFKFKISFEPK